MAAALEALRQSGKLHKAKIVGYKGGLKLICCCPYHRESTPSFAIFEDGGFHCMGCGISGVVSRHDGSSDDLLSHLQLDRPALPSPSRSKSPGPTALEPDLLDRAYRAALSLLKLRHNERQHLADRGLSNEDIQLLETRGYRSGPTSWLLRTAIADAAIAAIGKAAAHSLPFLQPSQKAPGGLICSDIPGLLIPVYDPRGRIVACKIRLTDQGTSRYLWWKARHRTASTGAPIHAFRSATATLAIVVEGPIKADLVGTLWPRLFGESVTVLAIPGATAHAGLAESLQQLGLKRVLLALDPDKAGRKTTQELQPRLRQAGFTIETASWPEELGKIDDFLANPSSPHHQLIRTTYQEPEAPPPPVKPFSTMEEARSAARPWLTAALLGERGTVHHMALEMGGGKTHLAVELVNELYDAGKLKGQAGLFTARHEQGEQFEGTDDWARHYGATYGFTDGEATTKSPCREPRRMLTVVNAGAPTKLACESCPQRADCSTNFARDPELPFLLAQRATTKERHLYNANSLRDPSVISKLSTILLDDLDLERTTVDSIFLDTEQLRKAILWAQRDLEYAPILPLLQALWAVLPNVPQQRFQYDAPRLNGESLQDALALQVGGLENLHSDLEMAKTAKDPHPFRRPRCARAAHRPSTGPARRSPRRHPPPRLFISGSAPGRRTRPARPTHLEPHGSCQTGRHLPLDPGPSRFYRQNRHYPQRRQWCPAIPTPLSRSPGQRFLRPSHHAQPHPHFSRAGRGLHPQGLSQTGRANHPDLEKPPGAAPRRIPRRLGTRYQLRHPPAD